eukprot:6799908-Pyramimonas_sp.AAC.2
MGNLGEALRPRETAPPGGCRCQPTERPGQKRLPRDAIPEAGRRLTGENRTGPGSECQDEGRSGRGGHRRPHALGLPPRQAEVRQMANLPLRHAVPMHARAERGFAARYKPLHPQRPKALVARTPLPAACGQGAAARAPRVPGHRAGPPRPPACGGFAPATPGRRREKGSTAAGFLPAGPAARSW